MGRSVDHERREVQKTFSDAVAWAESDGPKSFYEFERRLWTLLLALGRALVQQFLAKQAGRLRAVQYEHDGRRYVLRAERTSIVGTRFGKVSFTRPVGRRVGRGGTCDLPVDRELGLCAGFSLGVVLAMTRLCAQMAFASARDTFRQSHEWTPSPRAVLRMVDAVGDHARPFLEQVPAPDDDGEILVVQVDGRGAPMITETEYQRRRRRHQRVGGTRRHGRRLRRREHPRKRRKKGDKSKNAKVAVVGVIYTLHRTPLGIEGPINKRLIATFESHEALFVWLHREAKKRGYGKKQTVFLADGCEHIWRLQKIYFPDAEVCLDWYHVIEKLWSAGECIHHEGSNELRAWVGEQATRLRKGTVLAVIETLRDAYASIPKTGPNNKGKRERLDRILKHLVENQSRMRYRDLRRQDLDIGTGAAEGAVRNLIGIRLDGPGMRWSRGRSERLLHLRCVLLNGLWANFADHLAARDALTLRSSPIPTQTHEAKRREAA
jgi:hypothetical protein